MILHCSPSGAIERVIYALLEKEAIKVKKGEKPMLPLWLSPTQVRFIPIGDEFIKECGKFIQDLNSFSDYLCIRADIDDREESVSKKIRDAEKEWVPIIIVVGDKEKKTKKFSPRFRSKSFGDEGKLYSVEELHKLVVKTNRGFPQKALPLSMFLSKRPRFKG